MDENIKKFIKVLAEKTARDIIEQVSKDKELTILISKYLEDENEHFRSKTFFSGNHTWVKITDEWNGKVGLTDYAIRNLKDRAKLYTDKVGSPVRILEPFGVVETWTLMFDLYSPIAGRIIALNEKALENVGQIDSNTWLVEVHPLNHNALMKELELLMDEKKYTHHITEKEEQLHREKI